MPVHYSKQPGIPACGAGVTDNTQERVSRWSSTPRTRGKKTATAVESSQTQGDVDCPDCLDWADAKANDGRQSRAVRRNRTRSSRS